MVIQLFHGKVSSQTDLTVRLLNFYPLDILLFPDISASFTEILVFRWD